MAANVTGDSGVGGDVPADAVTVRSDRVFRFDAAAPSVWEAISRVEDYQRWWPWLRRCDARGLFEGDRWQCTIRPPLPYSMTFALTMTHVDAPHRVDAVVSGDIDGTASIRLRATERGCEVRLVSALAPRAPPLLAVVRALPRLARFGHDRVLDAGYREFRGRAV